ncbi:hypothetical protein E2C01_087578 [Portunus trituberculatus]|uniref:Uncharacterized protein n=1 Tax=Portunus trituberculatus TaxID=210409 RepID=A0A5B7JGR5_PORTR|nr:hypothetical protein [Portunus trituberculatus]
MERLCSLCGAPFSTMASRHQRHDEHFLLFTREDKTTAAETEHRETENRELRRRCQLHSYTSFPCFPRWIHC